MGFFSASGNGKGFDTKAKRNAICVTNMEKHAENMHGKLEISCALEKVAGWRQGLARSIESYAEKTGVSPVVRMILVHTETFNDIAFMPARAVLNKEVKPYRTRVSHQRWLQHYEQYCIHTHPPEKP